MAAVLFRLTSVPVLDNNGDPVSGALAYFYETGTLTPTPVYQDAALTIEHTHPVVANAAGVLPPIYLNSDVTYRLRITDADGALIDESDPYADLSAQEILDKLLSVDGAGSGLDADLVRGTTPSAGGLAILAGTLVQSGIDGSDLTLTPSLVGRLVRNINSVSRSVVISPQADNAWPAGSFMLLGSWGSGNLVVTRGTGVSLTLAGTNKNVTIAAGGFGLLFRLSSDQWGIIGSGLS